MSEILPIDREDLKEEEEQQAEQRIEKVSDDKKEGLEPIEEEEDRGPRVNSAVRDG